MNTAHIVTVACLQLLSFWWPVVLLGVVGLVVDGRR